MTQEVTQLEERTETCLKAIEAKHGVNPSRAFYAGRAAGGVMQIDQCPACGEGVLRYRIDGNGDIDAHCTNRETCGVQWKE